MIAATYFDGRSARLHPVHLDLRGGRVTVIGADVYKVYPHGAVTLAEPYASAPGALDFDDGARCELAEAAQYRKLAATLGYRATRVQFWQARWTGAAAALALLLAAIGAAALWGIPAAADRLAAALPPALDVTLGRQALATLERHTLQPSRLSEQRLAELQRLFAGLRPAAPRLPLTLLMRVVPGLGANALALPDGSIVLTDMMVARIVQRPAAGAALRLDETLDPVQRAQVAGVLAHEIGHVQARHSMRALARSSLTLGLSVALFGDFSAVASGAPALLLQMRYSREMESEADRHAIALLHAHGMPALPLAQLFERLREDSPPSKLPAWLRGSLDYLASHPPSPERAALMRAADAALAR